MKRRVYRTVLIAVLVITALIMLYPIYISLVISFDKSVKFAVPTPPPIIPKDFSDLFYKVAFTNMPLVQNYMNTLAITVIVLALKLVFCFMCSYAISKGRFKLRQASFILVLATMMVPFQALLVPSYILMYDFSLLDTWMPIIVMSLLSPIAVFLFKQFLDELPNELRESAYMDGAHELTVCYRVYFPLCGPVIATVAILTIVGEWNNYLWGSLMLRTRSLFTVPVAMAVFSFDKNVIIGPRAAGAMAGAIPLLLVFLFLQKYVVSSIATSGIKQ